MTDRAKVRITLDSDLDGEKQTQNLVGEWYRKDHAVYIRYEERTDYGHVRTTVRWREGELSVRRHGDVESEQQFAAGSRRSGQYVSQEASFRLETETRLLWMLCGDLASPVPREPLAERIGKPEPEGEWPKPTLPMLIEWHYTLIIEEQPSGEFVIRLRVEEL